MNRARAGTDARSRANERAGSGWERARAGGEGREEHSREGRARARGSIMRAVTVDEDACEVEKRLTM